MSTGPEGLRTLEEVYGLPPGTIKRIGPEAAVDLAWALLRDRLIYGASYITEDGRQVSPEDVSPSSSPGTEAST